MPIELWSRAKNAWNAFINNKDPTENKQYDQNGFAYSYRPDRTKLSRGSERSIINAVYNRIAMDVAAVDIRHVRLDDNDRFLEIIDSDLNECLSVEANLDQTGRSFIQDIVMSMFDEGCIAVIPIDTEDDPDDTGSLKIYTMRTAKILVWKPNSVVVKAYDERTGKYGELEFNKRNALIIENPLYSVMNEANSTMQRLIRKLSLLDSVDEQSSSGKLDLIIQLPYSVRSELRKQQAKERKSEIEQQLMGSKYGIAYIDSTEHITQLNRAVENNLMSQIEYLTNMVYSQLGITAEILNGTADEKTMLNYNNRTIEPILSAIIGEMKRKWLTKTARSQKQSIMFFRDPFKLVPISNIAEIADKFTRNEIMTSNEVRQIVGMKKSDDPNADQLRNKNLNQSAEQLANSEMPVSEIQNGNAEAEEIASDMELAKADYDSAMADLDKFDASINDLQTKLDGIKHSIEFYGIAEAENFDDWLAHYASPYYDPVAAHEYYMKHRKLVGRNSTSDLSDEGKEMAAHIKKNLDSEMNTKLGQSKTSMDQAITRAGTKRDAILSRSSEKMKADIERFRNQISNAKEAHAKAMNSRIKALSAEVSASGKTDEQKASIRAKIESLREENSKKREELTQNFNNLSSKAKSDNASIADRAKSEANSTITSSKETYSNAKTGTKEEYSEKYGDELDKLRDAGYTKEAEKAAKSSSSAAGAKSNVKYWQYQASKNKKK